MAMVSVVYWQPTGGLMAQADQHDESIIKIILRLLLFFDPRYIKS